MKNQINIVWSQSSKHFFSDCEIGFKIVIKQVQNTLVFDNDFDDYSLNKNRSNKRFREYETRLPIFHSNLISMSVPSTLLSIHSFHLTLFSPSTSWFFKSPISPFRKKSVICFWKPASPPANISVVIFRKLSMWRCSTSFSTFSSDSFRSKNVATSRMTPAKSLFISSNQITFRFEWLRCFKAAWTKGNNDWTFGWVKYFMLKLLLINY